MVIMDSICEGCPLRGTSKKGKVAGNVKDATFLVITNPPDRRMLHRGSSLSDDAMTVFSNSMEKADFSEEDFVY